MVGGVRAKTPCAVAGGAEFNRFRFRKPVPTCLENEESAVSGQLGGAPERNL